MADPENPKVQRGFNSLGVRRWGESSTTDEVPIVIESKTVHGGSAGCTARGCIGLAVRGGGLSRLVHLTTDEALRLSDLLRAMAESDRG